jgi:hypothetical protein
MSNYLVQGAMHFNISESGRNHVKAPFSDQPLGSEARIEACALKPGAIIRIAELPLPDLE